MTHPTARSHPVDGVTSKLFSASSLTGPATVTSGDPLARLDRRHHALLAGVERVFRFQPDPVGKGS